MGIGEIVFFVRIFGKIIEINTGGYQGRAAQTSSNPILHPCHDHAAVARNPGRRASSSRSWAITMMAGRAAP
jgi:hypothetical protein